MGGLNPLYSRSAVHHRFPFIPILVTVTTKSALYPTRSSTYSLDWAAYRKLPSNVWISLSLSLSLLAKYRPSIFPALKHEKWSLVLWKSPTIVLTLVHNVSGFITPQRRDPRFCRGEFRPLYLSRFCEMFSVVIKSSASTFDEFVL